jgi:hypothetical protein
MIALPSRGCNKFNDLVVVQFDVVAASLSVSRRTMWRRKAASTSNYTTNDLGAVQM